MKQWLKAHPESNSGNTYRKTHPEKAKEYMRRFRLKRYDMTPDDYVSMWQAQDGKCANPGCRADYPLDAPNYRFALQVDHCHESGRVRGLLCPGCNIGLGHLAENPDRISGLIAYLTEG